VARCAALGLRYHEPNGPRWPFLSSVPPVVQTDSRTRRACKNTPRGTLQLRRQQESAGDLQIPFDVVQEPRRRRAVDQAVIVGDT
jgi:hypothetical protein